nr:GNAT family N-acetyltransferase [Micromonospora sp. DSM 115978]
MAATTARLALRMPEQSDLRDLYALYAEPRVWASDPISRHDSVDQTARMIGNWRAAWARDGLGMWTAWSATDPDQGTTATFVGIGGCFLRHQVAWNLGFRLSPRFWGFGYAQEISRAAVAAARARRPDLPLTAYLLEGNARSRRTLERLGLHQVWRGQDAGNPDSTAIRLLYSDQPLPAGTIEALTER